MDQIKGYVMCALLASAVAGILKTLSSSMRSFEKYVGLVSALVVVVILSAPLVSVISEINGALAEDFPDISDTEEGITDGKEAVASYYIKSVESTVKDIISKRFKLSDESFDVSAQLGEDYSVEGIVIYLYTDTDATLIKAFTENILCIKTEIRRK